MKLIDLIYYISYKAYIRYNDSFGAFTLLALWMSILQTIILYNVALIGDTVSQISIIDHINDTVHIIIISCLFLINYAYVYFRKRKERILEYHENLGVAKERKYWFILVLFFFLMLGLFITLLLLK